MAMQVRYRKGIAYFPTFEEAREVSKGYEGSRVVHYELGWAVQYRVSGPYFPEVDDYHVVNGEQHPIERMEV